MDEPHRQRIEAAIGALKEYQGKGAEFDDVRSLIEVLSRESDRGLVIILVTYIEDALLERLFEALPNGEQFKRDLTHGGPLRAFEHRITVARALGLISDYQALFLDGLRTMRNACSHARQPVSFETPELRRVFSAMLGLETDEVLTKYTSEEVKGSFILFAANTILLVRGYTLKDAQEISRRAAEETAAEGMAGRVQSERVLLEALRRTQNDKPALASHPPPTDRAR